MHAVEELKIMITLKSERLTFKFPIWDKFYSHPRTQPLPTRSMLLAKHKLCVSSFFSANIIACLAI